MTQLTPQLRTWRMLLAAAIVILGTSACLPDTGSVRPSNDPVSQAQRDVKAGRHDRAARTFERLAATSGGAERDAYLLDASRAWFNHGESVNGLATLKKVRGPLPQGDVVIDMLQVTGLLIDNRAQSALSRLGVIQNQVPPSYQPVYLELTARAQAMSGNAEALIETLSNRESFLRNESSVRQNRKLIWLSLRNLGRKGHELAASDNADDNVIGWLELARLYRDNRRNPVVLREQISRWNVTHPTHMAALITSDLLSPEQTDSSRPGRVALLLPLNGRFAGAGIAIRDGFMAAYLDDNDTEERPAIRVYDTSSGDVETVYQNAVREGAQFVVGPLSKRNVGALIENKSIATTTLALNYLPDNTFAPSNFYQFSLAPEHESIEVARSALTNNLSRGVVLYPDSDLGVRLMESFRRAFESGGGVVLDANSYDTSEKDFGLPITQLLNLNSSKARHRGVSATVGTELEFEPRRRQDTQFVFLIANAEQGRLIRPQLNYHYANDLPVLATASIYENDPTRNRKDLDGVVIADAPWMVSSDPDIVALRAALNRYWPNRITRRGRLYAMGMDAYHLIPQLYNTRQPLETGWAGMSGRLVMESGNRISRGLDVAVIEGGTATSVEILPVNDAGLEGGD